MKCTVRVVLALVAASGWAYSQPAGPASPLVRRVKVLDEEASYFYTHSDERTPRPLLVLAPADVDADRQAALNLWRQVQEDATSAGWRLLIPASSSRPLWSDWGMLAIRRMVEEEAARGGIDWTRIYLLGIGPGTPVVFSAVSRLPDLWAAAIAVEGTPKPAIDQGRIFAANAAQVPLIWIISPATQHRLQFLIEKLRAAHFPFNLTSAENLSLGQVFATFSQQVKTRSPEVVDFETDSLSFARCHWVEVAEIDASQRNDVLPPSRVKPGSGASLSIGPFGFHIARPGPGVVVEWLPPGYQGPLRLEDRIVALRGKEIEDAAAYQRMMDEETEPAEAAVTILREGKRQRLEAKIVLPRRVLSPTARVKAERLGPPLGIQLISRGASRLRVHMEAGWIPNTVNWNGTNYGSLTAAGCWELTLQQHEAAPCAAAPAESKTAP